MGMRLPIKPGEYFMNSRYALGIDVGTSGCKAIVVNNDLRIIAKATREYPLLLPQIGWTEQSPESWWEAVKECIRQLTSSLPGKDKIEVMGLSGQMHGLVALDTRGEILRPCILWNDQRSAPYCERIYERVGGKDKLLGYTNNSMLPGYTGGKILWLRDNEPAIYEKIAHILLPKDYIRYRLTGEIATDVSDASGTGLFDVRNRRWAPELLDILDIPPTWLPEVYESSEIVSHLSQRMTSELGLPSSLPLVGGGGDAVLQALGAGVTSKDTALTVIGTGGNVTMNVSGCPDNPEGKLQVFCNAVPGRWVVLGVTLTAGGALRWFRDTLGGVEALLAQDLQRTSYEILTEEAENSPPGSNGLIFIPYLLGERCVPIRIRMREAHSSAWGFILASQTSSEVSVKV